ncbi:hypothetical protein [Gilliamella sp. wkB112]|uniref:hypothetical protein n=1 Tax=Gilliamella sp. wkB112 TaxID=3120257 RepID=UPI00080E2421|nr:hypothetical protein [Gilliamella apicola]OCG01274.1 hypothetical protein A9G12_01595 [Gilliamella apicola]
MKISNILTCAIVSILVISCAKKPISQSVKKEQPVEIDQLTALKQQTEHNNPFVVDAKNRLLQFVNDKNFDDYITKRGILACSGDENQTSCVLNFYLQEYYKLKYDVQIKRVIEENQTEHNIELSKIEATQINIDKYCQLSADFVAAIYTNDKANISKHFKPLFRMSEQNMSSLYTKVSRDSYSHFLIDENPSMLQEIKADYVEKCLDDPKDNIINYFNLFR